MSSDASSDTQANDLRGVNARTATSELTGTLYVMSNKAGLGFYRYTDDYMPQNKAFITVTGSGAREFYGFGETTGINSVSDERTENADVWYSLDGRKIMGKPSEKGIYIKRGRKEVVR